MDQDVNDFYFYSAASGKLRLLENVKNDFMAKLENSVEFSGVIGEYDRRISSLKCQRSHFGNKVGISIFKGGCENLTKIQGKKFDGMSRFDYEMDYEMYHEMDNGTFLDFDNKAIDFSVQPVIHEHNRTDCDYSICTESGEKITEYINFQVDCESVSVNSALKLNFNEKFNVLEPTKNINCSDQEPNIIFYTIPYEETVKQLIQKYTVLSSI